MTAPFYPQTYYIDEEHLWTDDKTTEIWLIRERMNIGPACCLKHFSDGGRGGPRRPRCRADRRGVEDCGR